MKRLSCWLPMGAETLLSRCMSYFGRVSKVAKSDNMVQWVKHGSQYERPFTESTDEWANHYDIIPDITRVRKPKDKAPVESLVDQVYKYVYARLRNTVFYTLDELNRAIFALMDEYNSRPMQVKGVSRDVLYFQDEYPVMHALPEYGHPAQHMMYLKLPLQILQHPRS